MELPTRRSRNACRKHARVTVTKPRSSRMGGRADTQLGIRERSFDHGSP